MVKSASKSNIYKITFFNQNKIYEIYAKDIAHSTGLFGFIEISDLIFDKNSSLVVDPSEERLKQEFAGVKRTYLPMHSILRIDEVEKEGSAKIREVSDKNNVAKFPVPLYTPDPSNNR